MSYQAPLRDMRFVLHELFDVSGHCQLLGNGLDRELIDGVLRRIVAREMAGPASLFLESWRPLGAVTGQGMHALTPFVGVLMDADTWERLARYMQRRGAIPWMLDRLDALQRESVHRVSDRA